MVNNAWRKKDNLWQSRHFLLSSIVRLGQPINPTVYEFIDHLIESGYKAPISGLDSVDIEVKSLYQKYCTTHGR